MKRTTKQHLVVETSNVTGIKHDDVILVIDAFLDALATSLAAGKEVALREFGTFGLRVSRRSLGRDPKRPDVPIAIPDQQVVRFKPGQGLKEAVAKLPVPPREK